MRTCGRQGSVEGRARHRLPLPGQLLEPPLTCHSLHSGCWSILKSVTALYSCQNCRDRRLRAFQRLCAAAHPDTSSGHKPCMRPACPGTAPGSQRSAPRGPSWDIFPLPCHLLEPCSKPPTSPLLSAISLTKSSRNWSSCSSSRADILFRRVWGGLAEPAPLLYFAHRSSAWHSCPTSLARLWRWCFGGEKERLSPCRAQQECATAQPPLRLWPPAGPREDRCALTCPKKRKGSRNVRPRHIQDWKPSAEDEGLLRARSLRGCTEPSS